MNNAIWLGIIFASILGVGLLGMGMYHLLPQATRKRIENMGNE